MKPLDLPESLRALLDRGGDPLVHVDAATLADHAIVTRRTKSTAERASMAAYSRYEIDAMLTGSSPVPDWMEFDPGERAREIRLLVWSAELDEDDELCRRVERLLPPPVVDEAHRAATELTSPYRLVGKQLDRYRCAATGQVCSGPALVIESVDLTDPRPQLVFSPGAIEAALRNARGTRLQHLPA